MSDPMTTQQPVLPEPEAKPGANRWDAWLPTVKDTVAAIALALVVGAVLIIFSTPRVIESLSYFFSYPWDFFKYAAIAVWDGYAALLDGSIGSPGAFVRTLERAAPLICAGLGVSLAFRAGMFNIGAQGQMLVGGILCGYIGFHYDLPPGLHLLLAVVGAVVAAGLWGGIAGFLKARTGAHEVITTIMLNYVGRFLLLYFLARESFQRPGEDNLLSPPVDDSAAFPSIAGVHTGVLLAVLAAVVIWWLLERSTWGFEIRAVGANPDAARTAGMSVARVYITAMTVAGMLAGLAVAMQLLGRQDPLGDQIAGSIGFDAITVALLGRATPLGTVLAGLLFGALASGGVQMQASAAATPVSLTLVLQALIVLFVAAPALVRGAFRMKDTGGGATVMAKGWGS